MDIEDTTLGFLDVETTGLSSSYGDKICEIGFLKCRGDKVIDSFETLINPKRPISPGASAINGITDDMVVDAPFTRQHRAMADVITLREIFNFFLAEFKKVKEGKTEHFVWTE